jgi:hypothetical protein
VSVSDAGDALVVNPVQDATALPGVVSPEAEGLMAVGDESTAEAAPEPVIIPPIITQPSAVDNAPAAQQITPEEADEAPPVDRPEIDNA